MEDIEYEFENLVVSCDVDMPEWVDIHDKYGIYIDSVDVKKVKEEKESVPHE
mgnify:CR=1 FL=1|tara:strand:+ start:126 stop:281 length:156 start_codon:yes stop_codon:yes gene_type:complete